MGSKQTRNRPLGSAQVFNPSPNRPGSPEQKGQQAFGFDPSEPGPSWDSNPEGLGPGEHTLKVEEFTNY